MNDEQQATEGRRHPPFPGSFEGWLQGQVDREGAAGAVARFVLEDRERGCWVDAFGHDSYMMRKEKMRQGIVRHVILQHNLSGKPRIVLEQLHREYEEARARDTEQFCEWMREEDRWIW